MAKLFKKSPSDSKEPSREKPGKTEFSSYQSFRLQRKISPEAPKLDSSFRLFKNALRLLKGNAKLFLGVVGIYALLYLLLVQGITALDNLKENKAIIEQSVSGDFLGLATGFALFTQLLGTSGSLSPTASVYQFLVTLLASLALIWTLRQVYSNKQQAIRIRDAYYQGMYPIVPFLLVLVVVLLELLPMALGGTVLSTVIQNGIAATALEIALWGTGFFVLALVSLYLIASSLFALYIVSLPNMGPMQALRSAHQLVQGRRWLVLRKIIFLPIILLVLAAILMVPLILFITPVVGWVFFAVTVVALAVAHSYMYGLYRSLI